MSRRELLPTLPVLAGPLEPLCPACGADVDALAWHVYGMLTGGEVWRCPAGHSGLVVLVPPVNGCDLACRQLATGVPLSPAVVLALQLYGLIE